MEGLRSHSFRKQTLYFFFFQISESTVSNGEWTAEVSVQGTGEVVTDDELDGSGNADLELTNSGGICS